MKEKERICKNGRSSGAIEFWVSRLVECERKAARKEKFQGDLW